MNRSWLMVVSLILIVVGLFVILNSVSWGSAAANSYLLSHGGGMDTAQFVILIQEYIIGYRWIGSILSVIGALSFVRVVEVK